MSKARDLAIEAEGRLTVAISTRMLLRAIVAIDAARNGWPATGGGGGGGGGGSPVEAMSAQPDPAAAAAANLHAGLTRAHNAVTAVWSGCGGIRHRPVTVDDIAVRPMWYAGRTRWFLHDLIASDVVTPAHLPQMSHVFGGATVVWSVCIEWTTPATRPKSEELTWCELHAQIGSQEPAARRKRMRGRPPMPLCSWCYAFQADEGRLPTLKQVDHRARGIPVRRREG